MSTTTVKGVINIVQGKKKEFTLDIEKGDDPFDLSAAGTIVRVCFPGTTTAQTLSTETVGELTITNATLGKVSGVLPSAKSALIAEGEGQDLQVEVDSGGTGEFEAVILSECLNVVANIC